MKALATTLVLVSALALSGCASIAPSQKAPMAPSTVSQPTSAASTPTPEAKPAEVFVSAPMAPEDPAVIKQISELKVCSMAVFMDKLWGSVVVNPKVPAEHQARAADYVTKIEAKKAELGCK